MFSRRLLVTGLALLLFGSMGAGTWSGLSARPGPRSPSIGVAAVAAPATVDIQGFAFNPATLTVVRGTMVTWTNRDSVTHTVTAVQPPGVFDSGPLGTGATFSFTFNTTGTFGYRCNIHPTMTGTIVVREAPTPTPTPCVSRAISGTVTLCTGYVGPASAAPSGASGGW